MKDILFIINPKAGRRSRKNLEKLISEKMEKCNKTYSIIKTEYGGHASKIVKKNLHNYKVFCAAGGDGTMNEVSSELVNSGKILGLIPLGSGNGLARFLKIPLKTEKAIDRIIKGDVKAIDSCTINHRHFLNLAGIGFDAYIAHQFAKSSKRGFQTYVKETIKALINYRTENYQITLKEKQLNIKALSVIFGNSNQFGNNAKICPGAEIDDGMIELCLVKPFPFFRSFDLAFKLFMGNIDKSKYVSTYRTSKIIIKNNEELYAHFDGEPVLCIRDIEIKVVPKSISIII